MRTYAEAWDHAEDRAAFSNGTEWECWSENWCHQCRNDSLGTGNEGDDCPLILVALMQRTPSEWLRQEKDRLGDRFHCIEYRPLDDGGGGPKPPPKPIPGQGELIPAEPYIGARMFADVVAANQREQVTA